MQFLKSRYDTIFQSLCTDYEQTLDTIQDQLTDDQICQVLICSDHKIANKVILDCLIEKIKCVTDFIELCDQLQLLIPSSPCLTDVVGEIQMCMYIPYNQNIWRSF